MAKAVLAAGDKITLNEVGRKTLEPIGALRREATEKLEKALAGDGQVERVKKPEWDQLDVNAEDHTHITW